MDIIPWDLQWRGNILFPVDEKVHAAATEFCRDHLAASFDPRGHAKIWVARENDSVVGVAGIKSCWDIPVFRSISEKASFRLADRVNSYFADQGFRGQGVFLYLSQSESPEQMCPHREAILSKVDAKPAERYVVTCK
jgi:hypothetical protein